MPLPRRPSAVGWRAGGRRCRPLHHHREGSRRHHRWGKKRRRRKFRWRRLPPLPPRVASHGSICRDGCGWMDGGKGRAGASMVVGFFLGGGIFVCVYMTRGGWGGGCGKAKPKPRKKKSISILSRQCVPPFSLIDCVCAFLVWRRTAAHHHRCCGLGLARSLPLSRVHTRLFIDWF